MPRIGRGMTREVLRKNVRHSSSATVMASFKGFLRFVVRAISEVYLTIFVLSFRLGARESPAANARKGVIGISLIEGLPIVSALSWLQTQTGQALPPGSWQIWALALLPFLLNHYLLVINGCGTSFEKNFNMRQRRERVLLRSAALTVVVMTIAITYFTATALRKKYGIES